MSELIDGTGLINKLIASGIIEDGPYRRVIIDAPFDGLVTLYVERLVDEKILEVIMDSELKVVHALSK